MSLNNFSVRTRLIVSFVVMLFVILLLSFLSHQYAKKVNDQFKIIESETDKQLYINEWINLANVGATNWSARIFNDDPVIAKQLEDRMLPFRDRVIEIKKYIDENLDDEQELAFLKKLSEAEDDFKKIRVIGSKLGDEKEVQPIERTKFLMEVYLPAMDKYRDGLLDIMALQDQRLVAAFNEVHNIEVKRSRIFTALTGFSLLFVIVVTYLITRSILRPLNQANHVIKEIARGNLAVEVPKAGKDELGALLDHSRDMVSSLKMTVNQVDASARSITTALFEIDAGNQNLAVRTEEQAGSVVQTAGTLEEITRTIESTSSNAQLVNTKFRESGALVEQNGQNMRLAAESMNDIERAASKMTEIIAVIEGIAFQTNILALNAAVEAARAGEQGRGFAVVAGEVRTLAQRSSNSAREIREIINDSVAKISHGRDFVTAADQGMTEIVEKFTQVQILVDEIALSTTEQNEGIRLINSSMAQIDDTTQQNAALVEQATAASASLNEQAKVLISAVELFDLGHDSELEHDKEFDQAFK